MHGPKPTPDHVTENAGSDENKPDPVGDTAGGFSDLLPPVSGAPCGSETATEASEELSRESSGLRFEEVNEVTLKLTDGGGSNVPHSHGQWGGYRAARALAWVINIGPGHKSWLARCGDRSIGPTTIGKAKKAALAMVTDQGMGKVLDDPVMHLNRQAARLYDAEPQEG